MPTIKCNKKTGIFAGQGLSCLTEECLNKFHHPIISDLQECKFHYGTDRGNTLALENYLNTANNSQLLHSIRACFRRLPETWSVGGLTYSRQFINVKFAEMVMKTLQPLHFYSTLCFFWVWHPSTQDSLMETHPSRQLWHLFSKHSKWQQEIPGQVNRNKAIVSIMAVTVTMRSRVMALVKFHVTA